MRLSRTLWVAFGCSCITIATNAQDRTGEAEVGFQQFLNSQRVSNALGLTLGYREFIPDTGILSISLAPAAANGRFRAGESFVELKRFPWLGNYWTFRAGDFRIPGRLTDVQFSNLFYPEITGRGAWVEATHGGRTVGFFAGA
jgi:hypothetical protein